jgi:hypothetical protein
VRRRVSGLRWVAGGGAIAIVLLIAYVAWRTRQDANGAGRPTALPRPAERGAPGAGRFPVPPTVSREVRRSEPDDARFAAQLRERFGRIITNRHAQIKAIEKLIRYLMHFYPDDWRERVYDLLKEAFPDLADALYAQFEKLMRYNDWLREHRDELAVLPREERRDALWRKRFEVFGEDAYEIWAAALKNEQVHTALDTLRESPTGTVNDKLDFFLEVVRGSYGAQAEAFIEKRQTELMGQFLAVESVQDDLHAMSAAERQEQLRQIRRALGLDEAALQRWDTLDAERDRAWERGEQYLRERAAIVAASQGDQQQRRLHELQDRLFGPEAELIRAEESAGFYRFERRRVFGKE